MVQRKAPHRWLGSQAELKINSHVNTSKTSSQQQDARSRRGGGGGSEDIKKKMKMERSIIAAELDSLQGFKNSRPNYMKPTSSSNARTEVSNLKPPRPSKKPAAPKGTGRPSAKKSLRGVVVVSRATCSSTLKGSMFPKALDLAPGATEAEGTSAMRVCPYTYCSLNGHRHEPLPPLRRFVSARRRLLKTQKSTKLRVLSSFKVKGLLKEEKEEEMEIDTGQEALVSNDFFVEIYTTKPEEKNKPEVHADDGELVEDEIANNSYSDVPSSEVSDEDVDVAMNFLEYVECDPRVEEEEDADEKDTLGLVRVGLHTESCSEVDASGEGKTEIEKETEVEHSERSEEYFGLPRQVTREAEDDELLREVDATEVALSTEDTRRKNDDGPAVQEIVVDESTLEEDWVEEVEDASSLSIAQLFDSCDNLSELEKLTSYDAEDVTSPDDAQNCAYDGQSEREHQEKSFNLEESIDEMKARMRITRKKMSEDLEESKEFNPRGPRFLLPEPDPEAEKVDLRHQMMDERKNSEEWMIDYALRRAVMKLAPAPKKKVAVLVEAFETVAPLPAWGKPRRHSTPGFSHARIIQACN